MHNEYMGRYIGIYIVFLQLLFLCIHYEPTIHCVMMSMWLSNKVYSRAVGQGMIYFFRHFAFVMFRYIADRLFITKKLKEAR